MGLRKKSLQHLALSAFLASITGLLSACGGSLGPTPRLPSQVTMQTATPSEQVSAVTTVPRNPLAVGLFYSTWHCPESRSPRIIARVLDGLESWGPIASFHWWDRPWLGTYCLATDDNALARHAEMLGEMGVDFIILDSTNHTFNDSRSDRPSEMVLEPLTRLLEVWSRIDGAPRVVPWVGISPGPNAMIDAILDRMALHPEMHYLHEGRPMVLAVPQFSDNGRITELASGYTIRQMWGLLGNEDETWSFLQPCVPQASGRTFKAAQGNQICDQRKAIRSGRIEQISVTTAYQQTYLSDSSSAVPKFKGKTLLRQLETAYLHPEAKFLTITGWNEWIAQRFCPPGVDNCNASNDSLPDGNKVFTDLYDWEYNRDLEPGGITGDYYFRLTKAALAHLRAGHNPMQAWNEKALSILGFIDGVAMENGRAFVTGWACMFGNSRPIAVHLYTGAKAGSPGAMLIDGAAAELPSEPEVSRECGLGYQAGAYRYRIELPAHRRAELTGKPIFVHGIFSRNHGNPELLNSGKFTVPAP